MKKGKSTEWPQYDNEEPNGNSTPTTAHIQETLTLEAHILVRFALTLAVGLKMNAIYFSIEHNVILSFLFLISKL